MRKVRRTPENQNRSISLHDAHYRRMTDRKGRLTFTHFIDVLLNVWDELTPEERIRHFGSPIRQESQQLESSAA
jgi:hypothetical protein